MFKPENEVQYLKLREFYPQFINENIEKILYKQAF
jgi:hypothetical protein